MRFAISGDWHLSGYINDKKAPESNLSERLHYIKESMYSLVEYCRKNDIDTVVVAGDILHNKSIIHTIAQAVLLKFLRDNPDITFIIVDGNHDLEGKGDNVVSALMSIDNEPNVKRVGTEDGMYKDEENDILYVPYSSKMVDIIKNNSAKYLVSHFGLNEGMLSSGQSIIADLSITNLIGKYETVILGHYHKPQEISNADITIYYTGSLIHLNWNDKNEEKRFLDVDIDNEKIISIPTTGYKQYVELEVTEENKSEILKEARRLKEDGHLVNIRKEEKFDTDDIEDEFVIVDRTERDITNRGIDTSMSEVEILEKYMAIKEIKETEQGKYKDIAIDVISEAV